MAFGFRALLSFKSLLNENWAYLQALLAVLCCSLACAFLYPLETWAVVIYKAARPCLLLVFSHCCCAWKLQVRFSFAFKISQCRDRLNKIVIFKKKFWSHEESQSNSSLFFQEFSILPGELCSPGALHWFVPSVLAAPRSVHLHFKQCGNKMAETKSGYLKYLILC